MMADFAAPALIALTTSLVAAPWLIRLAERWGVVDRPGPEPHKVHTRPTPLAGGAAVGLGVLLACLLWPPVTGRAALGLAVAAALVFGWGLADDGRGLPARVKFLGQFGAALALFLTGMGAHLTDSAWLNLLITFVWVVGVVNAFNFMDSLDSLALGMAALAAAFFGVAAAASGQPGLTRLAGALLGASAGTLLFNLTPARLFLGDSGSQLIGLLLAALGLAYAPPGDAAATWFRPVLFLGVPIFNTTLVVVSRLRRGRKVLAGHRDHLAHRLGDLGLARPRVVLAVQLTALVLGLVAWVVWDWSPPAANRALLAVLLTGGVCIALLERFAPPEPTP
jgi:UDP-GlcNAc:undecaprenyl-phosphate/decaprenyl-phosphate GlcNAc-1-phosphate transferase